MKIFKWGLLGVLGVLLLVVALNWTTIQRLRTVNTLFDADKIVENFSSMDSAFLHHNLELGEAKPWPEDIQDIPETVTIAGVETNLTKALEELDTTALVIIRDGTLIHESYYKDTEVDDLRISWSVAKSFMSGLYGQAIEDGLMDIQQPIEIYLPQLEGTAYEGATVANILNMASGVRFNEDYMDPKSDINDMGRVLGLGGSMDKYTETLLDRQYEPGTVWQYVSIDTHVAAMALRKVTGKSLHQLWEETYGEHLGMGKNPFYLTDGKDVAFALGGLNLRTRDYAKFGQLFLQSGEWEGQQLVPAAWVKDSTINHAPNVHPVRGSGYGYQWWVPMPQEGPSKGDFFGVGIYGQYVYVNPAMNIVIAKNAADREFTAPQSNGQHSMNMNIDIFRSLAEQLTNEKVERFDISTDYTLCVLRAVASEMPLKHLDDNSLEEMAIELRDQLNAAEITSKMIADGATFKFNGTTETVFDRNHSEEEDVRLQATLKTKAAACLNSIK
ncbi:MAG: serine hydrolase [Litorimonas sp.]